MPKLYKCPICGCTEYYEIDSISRQSIRNFGNNHQNERKTSPRSLIEYQLSLEDAYIREETFNFNAAVCLCKKCGHIDLFNEHLLSDIKKEEAELNISIKEKKKELSLLLNKRDELTKWLSFATSRIEEISKLLVDQDITIRKHNELEEENETIHNKMSLIEAEKQELLIQIQKADDELVFVQERLKRVAICTIKN